MKVRTLTSIIIGHEIRDAGAIVDVADAMGADWIQRGLASETLEAPAPIAPETVASLEARVAQLEAENAELRAKLEAPAEPPKRRGSRTAEDPQG